MTSAVLVCAGKGERANFGFNKLLKEIDGVPVFQKTLYAFSSHPLIDEIIVVCSEEDEAAFKAIAEKLGAEVKFVRGGKDRSASVENGVNAAGGDTVAVHDGARPFVSAKIITDCVNSAIGFGSGVACVPATDTTAQIAYDGEDEYIVSATRNNIYKVQTPQAFNKKLLLKAFSLKTGDELFTDESGLFAKYIGRCRAVNGNERNRKLTTAEDFAPGENLRAGVGFDLHRLVEGRKLVLGGIEIPNDKGLLGHSDADVALHALMDALLGAAALGDIGRHFPDTDPTYKGADSGKLLDHVVELLKEKGYRVGNVDVTIVCQRPKLKDYIEQMREQVARHLNVDVDCVNIKATTTEKLGFEGEGLGISSQAVACIEKI